MVNSALNGSVSFYTKLLHLFIGVEDLMTDFYIDQVKILLDENLKVNLIFLKCYVI